MRFLPLIFRNAARNKRRTVLTVLPLAVALFLFVFFETAFANWASSADDVPESQRRLIVRNLSIANFLPESHAKLIAQVPGVALVTPWSFFGGRLKDRPKDFFATFAVETDTFTEAWGEYHLRPDVLEAWRKTRQGAIVGKKLLDKFGWHVGQSVTLTSDVYPTCEPMLVIVGSYEGGQIDEGLFFQRRYLAELLKGTAFDGRVGTYYVVVQNVEQLAAVTEGIDTLLATSQAPTKTETEKDFKTGMISLMGDMRGLIMNVTYAVLGVVLLVVSNTMAMAVRERTREIAIMKAIGYTPRIVVGLVLGEGVFTAALGGVVGCVGTRVLFENVLHRPTLFIYFPNFSPSWTTVAIGLVLSLAIGFLSAFLPAVQAARIQVVAGLRRVG